MPDEYDVAIKNILDASIELTKTVNELKIFVINLRSDFDNHDKYTAESLEKTEQLMDRRLQGMNEFREALQDQTKNFLTREEYSASHKLIEQRMITVEKIVWGALAILSFLTFAIPIVLHFVKVE